MATCKTCGHENKRLPEGWVDWECLQCYQELLYACDPEILADIARARYLYEELRSIQSEILNIELRTVIKIQTQNLCRTRIRT